MLKAESPDRFRVDFAQVKRTSGWRALFSKDPVVVDGLAIGRALIGAIAACPMRSPAGAPQVWNEYRLFLARPDHDRLRPLEATLQRDLMPMLYEELVRLNAVTIGGVVVRLLVDDAEDVEPGHAILHVRYAPDAENAPRSGEITMRLDKLPGGGTPVPTQRLSLGEGVLRSPAGDLALQGGVRYTLGRADPEGGPDHLAIPGATARINRRQLTVMVSGGHIEVTRDAGGNPVSVGSQALAPGQSVRERLPTEIVLSGGELRLAALVGTGA